MSFFFEINTAAHAIDGNREAIQDALPDVARIGAHSVGLSLQSHNRVGDVEITDAQSMQAR